MTGRRLVKGLLPLAIVLMGAAGCGSSQHRSNPSEFVFQAVPQRGQRVTTAGMRAARNIVSARLGQLPVSSPSVTVCGRDRLVLDVPGAHRTAAKTAAIAASAGALQFFDFEADLAPPTVTRGNPTPYGSLYGLLAAVRSEAGNGPAEAYYLFDRSHEVQRGPDPTVRLLLAPYGGSRPAGTEVLAVPAHREVVHGPISSTTTRPVGRSKSGVYWYLFKYFPSAPNGPPELTDKDLVPTKVKAETDPNTGVPAVQLAFTGRGAREFQRITRAEYERGRERAALAGHGGQSQYLSVYAQHTAIVLDGAIESALYIPYTDQALAHGVSGRYVAISMVSEGSSAARDLVVVLQSGRLPYTFEPAGPGTCNR
jgi:preprotein translocase subunit SecD